MGLNRLLIRHFFGRFFDREALSPQGEPEAGIVQTLGVLAVPGAFFVLLFRPLTLWGWSLVAVRGMFLLYSMVVMGFIMVFQWDALFLDRRDYQVLTPLPLKLRTVFLAKSAALAIFLAIFLLDINILSFVFWPGVDGGRNTLDILWAHMAAVLAGGLFAALAAAAIHGLLLTLFRGSPLKRISVAVQTLAMTCLVTIFFLIPMIAFGTEYLVEQNSPLLQWFPGYWFIGYYEQLRPVSGSELLRGLGGRAMHGLWIAAAIFLLTYLPGYRRLARRVLETPEPSPAGPGAWRNWVDAMFRHTILRNPVERAVFRFIGASLARSTKHRLFLATYGGFGAAVAIMSLRSGPDGLLTLPLTLSFVLVSGLRSAFNFPSELSANWTFQMAELFPARHYLAATRKWIVWSAIVPLFLLLAGMEFARFAWPVALFHLSFGILLSLFLVEVLFAGFRKVPFTCSHLPGKVNLVFLGVIYIFGFTLYSRSTARLELWLTARPAVAAIFLTVGAAAFAAIVYRRGRGARSVAPLDYEDRVDPAVRSLGLSPE